jgi:hypothetical protein
MSRTTELDVLEQFFEAVRPVSTNHPLIRIGGESDGGYLIPDDLDNVRVCFSPGVSKVASFESDLAQRGITSFLADYSVDAPPTGNDLFHFEKKYLGTTEDSVYMTLGNWVRRNAPDEKDMILQMDIEGAEYGIIFDTSSELLQRFRIIVIEFHRLQNLCDKQAFELINLTFKKLLKDFDVVHIHPNNRVKPVTYGTIQIPPLLEFTFLRKDRVLTRQPATHFPHPLDRKNITRKNDFALPPCWYRSSGVPMNDK